MQSLAATVRDAEAATGDADVARRLAGAYGSAWRDAWRLTRDVPALRQRIDDALPYTMAEAVYATRSEMAVTLGDLLVRRTHLAFETRDHGVAAAAKVAKTVAPHLGWDAARIHDELARYEREAERIFTIA
jgi:glycerol-3-phosphate dehydrogenase